MDIFTKPPRWALDLFPAASQETVEQRWPLVLGLVALVLLLIVVMLLRLIFRRRTPTFKESELQEDLTEIPKPPPLTGDRRLIVEGVPVRVRLVVMAPAGKQGEVKHAMVNKLLDKVLAGLGDIAAQDKPVVRVWPKQLSAEGFANTFNRNMLLPDEDEDGPSRWVLVNGRAKVAGNPLMIGLALLAVKPTTVGRKTLKPQDWDTVFRVKVRE